MVETSRIVEWLQGLVHIPSVGPKNAGLRSGAVDESRIAAQLATWFKALGGEVEREDVYPGRPNTYGIWRGQIDRWISVDVHIDTVGIETMIGDPFDGRLENGRVYGRDSVDTKASLGAVLALLEDMQHRGEVLKPNLVVCASSTKKPAVAVRRSSPNGFVGAVSNSINCWRPNRRCAHRSTATKARPTLSSKFRRDGPFVQAASGQERHRGCRAVGYRAGR